MAILSLPKSYVLPQRVVTNILTNPNLIKPDSTLPEISILTTHLHTLEVIKKGEYFGTLQAHKCHDNALMAVNTVKDTRIFVGYLITKLHQRDHYSIVTHSFNVSKGKVIEYTSMSRGKGTFIDSETYYIGKIVHPLLYLNKKWVPKFLSGT